MNTPYDNILDLLLEDLPFREQMKNMSKEEIDNVLNANRKDRFIEHYFLLVGHRVGDEIICQTINPTTQNDPGCVEFSWEDVWRRHVEHKDVVGWLHTHPKGFSGMSGVDKATFQSWLVGIGGPRYAVILCDNKVRAWELVLDGINLTYKECLVSIENKTTIIIRLEKCQG